MSLEKCVGVLTTYFDPKFCLKTKMHFFFWSETLCVSRKEFKCESCAKSFSQGGNLKKHVKKVHNFGQYKKLFSENPPEIQKLNQVTDCYFCHEIFNIENDLEKHLRSNHQKELTGVDWGIMMVQKELFYI